MKDLLERLFKRNGQGEPETVPEPEPEEPAFRYEDIPDTLDLGWYFSEGMQEFQMAKDRLIWSSSCPDGNNLESVRFMYPRCEGDHSLPYWPRSSIS